MKEPIILFNSSEKLFNTFGDGILSDVITCVVKEELNGSFELEMEYPFFGQRYSEIKLRKFIFVKPNPYDNRQAFRIYSISKPLDGVVTVSAEHISYDMSGYTIRPLSAQSLYELKEQLSQRSILPSPFIFNVELDSPKSFITKSPYNLRALLAGSESSILETYSLDYKFDMFTVNMLTRRGSNRGVVVRYGKNMTELEQSIDAQNSYTGIFPFYSKTRTETRTESKKTIGSMYLYSDVKPFYKDWLSSSPDESRPLTITIDNIPYKILTDGEYKNKLYAFRTSKMMIDVYLNNDLDEKNKEWFLDSEGGKVINPNTKNLYRVKSEGSNYNKVFSYTTSPVNDIVYVDISSEIGVSEFASINCDINGEVSEFSEDWLLNNSSKEIIDPEEYTIYIVSTDGDYKGNVYTWDKPNNTYTLYSAKGFFREMSETESITEIIQSLLPIKTTTETEDIEEYLDLIEDSDPNVFNGIIYSEGQKPSDPDRNKYQKILTLDLSNEFESVPTIEELRLKGFDYITNNNINTNKISTTTSFIRLSDSDEYKHLMIAETILLGDEIRVVHETLGIDEIQRVITTEYDAIIDQYTDIVLGSKEENVGDTVVTTGDNVSSLTNDANYTNEQIVGRLIADSIKTMVAEIDTAMIGNLEAVTAQIDNIVANKLISEDADINNILRAGEVEVVGKIVAESGNIGGCEIEDGVLVVSSKIKMTREKEDRTKEVTFQVDNDGRMEGSDINIKGGEINLTDAEGTKTIFSVNQNGDVFISSATPINPEYVTPVLQLGDTEYDSEGNSVGEPFIVNNDGSMETKNILITGGGINIKDNFIVDREGRVVAEDIEITGGAIRIGGIPENPNFEVTNEGNVRANDTKALGELFIGQYKKDDDTEAFYAKIDSGGVARFTELFVNNEYVNEDGTVTNIGDITTGSITTDYLLVNSAFESRSIVFSATGGVIEGTTGVPTDYKNFRILPGSTLIPGKLGSAYSVIRLKLKVSDYLYKRQRIVVSFQYTSSKYPGRTLFFSGPVYIGEDGGDNKLEYNVVVFSESSTIGGTAPTYTIVSDHTIDPMSFWQYNDSGGVYTISVDQPFVPKTDADLDLGTAYNRWNDIYASNATIQTSDRNLKKSIMYDISKYDKIFDDLKPSAYKLKEGMSGRTHLGLIAQDIEESLTSNDISTKDFAVLVKTTKPNTEEHIYGLRYEELHALEIRQIQLLKQQVKLLEERIKTIEDK